MAEFRSFAYFFRTLPPIINDERLWAMIPRFIGFMHIDAHDVNLKASGAHLFIGRLAGQANSGGELGRASGSSKNLTVMQKPVKI